jgi:hypothetical protein
MSDETRPGSRRGRSIVSALFVGVVSVFIVITTVQLGRGVFGQNASKANGGITLPAACIAGISRLAPALDRALAVASPIADENASLAAFAGATLPEWNDSQIIEQSCNATPEGQEAFAAVLRLRRAEEGFLHRQFAELSPMRRDVEAYLR